MAVGTGFARRQVGYPSAASARSSRADDVHSPQRRGSIRRIESICRVRTWIVLTKDDRIRYRVTERTALASARVRAFVRTSSQLLGTEMATAFVKALPRMKRLIANHTPPFIGRVQEMGSLAICKHSQVR